MSLVMSEPGTDNIKVSGRKVLVAVVLAAVVLAISAFFAGQAQAFTVMGFLTGQYQGQGPGGGYGTWCVYNVQGRDARVYIGIGVCPPTMQFRP